MKTMQDELNEDRRMEEAARVRLDNVAKWQRKRYEARLREAKRRDWVKGHSMFNTVGLAGL